MNKRSPRDQSCSCVYCGQGGCRWRGCICEVNSKAGCFPIWQQEKQQGQWESTRAQAAGAGWSPPRVISKPLGAKLPSLQRSHLATSQVTASRPKNHGKQTKATAGTSCSATRPPVSHVPTGTEASPELSHKTRVTEALNEASESSRNYHFSYS